MYIACRDVIILRGYLDIKERRKQTIMNNIDDLVEIYECPLCGGAGILEEDCGSSYYVTCLECGCHSVTRTDLMQQSALLIYGTVARLFQ